MFKTVTEKSSIRSKLSSICIWRSHHIRWVTKIFFITLDIDVFRMSDNLNYKLQKTDNLDDCTWQPISVNVSNTLNIKKFIRYWLFISVLSSYSSCRFGHEKYRYPHVSMLKRCVLKWTYCFRPVLGLQNMEPF